VHDPPPVPEDVKEARSGEHVGEPIHHERVGRGLIDPPAAVAGPGEKRVQAEPEMSEEALEIDPVIAEPGAGWSGD
jgi:hypothetical protein